MSTKKVPGLFERWYEIERKEEGRPTGEVLAGLNQAAGTQYKHNWPSIVASRDFDLERCPTEVRRYMMRKVLPHELKKLGLELDDRQIEILIKSLT